MGRVSGMEISSRGLIFGGFLNPWDEKISIPETRPIRKSYSSPLLCTFHVFAVALCSVQTKNFYVTLTRRN